MIRGTGRMSSQLITMLSRPIHNSLLCWNQDYSQEERRTVMKYLLIIFAAVAFIILPVVGHASDLGALRMGYIEGDVQINTDDIREWMPASINMPLKSGDRIWVPDDGRAEMQSRSGTFIRLDKNTSADVLRVEEHSGQFNVSSGAVYINFNGTDNLVQIDTPISSVRINKRSRVNIEVDENGDTNIAVARGTVAVEDNVGVTDVKEGDVLVLKRNQEARLYNLPAADDWDRWNANRDRMYSAESQSARYVPDDLRYYSRDLDDNGRWVEVRDYGWVWTPRTVVAVDWAPYRTGRWVWIDGDYVWVSYESWGWAPYHYGRWAHSPSVGWFWVPPRRGDVYWGPGYVGWVRTESYVSWVPLAPGDIYYGRGNYGHGSVNITNVNININKTVVNVYKNVNVNNSVTVVNHQSFVNGDYKMGKFDRNRYFNEKISVGGPNIPPNRNAKIPVLKHVASEKRPPERIRDIDVGRVKENRKLTKDSNISVMRQGARQDKKTVEVIRKPLDKQELKRERSTIDSKNKPGQSAGSEPRIDQGAKDRRDRTTTVNDKKGPTSRPDQDVRIKDSADRAPGKMNTQPGARSDRFIFRGDSGTGPAKESANRDVRTERTKTNDSADQSDRRTDKKPDRQTDTVRPTEGKPQYDTQSNFKGRTSSTDTNRPVQQKESPVFDKPRDTRSIPDSRNSDKPVIKRNNQESPHPSAGNATRHDGMAKDAKPESEHDKKVRTEKNIKTDKDVQPGKENQERAPR